VEYAQEALRAVETPSVFRSLIVELLFQAEQLLLELFIDLSFLGKEGRQMVLFEGDSLIMNSSRSLFVCATRVELLHQPTGGCIRALGNRILPSGRFRQWGLLHSRRSMIRVALKHEGVSIAMPMPKFCLDPRVHPHDDVGAAADEWLQFRRNNGGGCR
jgi:hypothetical protein